MENEEISKLQEAIAKANSPVDYEAFEKLKQDAIKDMERKKQEFRHLKRMEGTIVERLCFDSVIAYLMSSWKVYLPEWKGYWIGKKDATGNIVIVAYTRDKQYAVTPHIKYMLRTDFIAEPLTDEEYNLHKDFNVQKYLQSDDIENG